MRRRQTDDNASLDLLLDTICNTFGGVLFISMLVVVLLSTSPAASTTLAPPDEKVEADLINWEKQLADTRREMTSLRAALAAQREMAKAVLDPNIRELLEERRQQQLQRTNQEDDKLRLLQDVSLAQIEINRIAGLMAELTRAMQTAAKNLQRADEQLQQEVALRTRSAKLPRMRRTKKEPVLMFLRNGRLTSYHAQQPDGSLAANPLEVEERKDGAGFFLQPRKNAGLVVEPGNIAPAEVAKIEKKIRGFDAEKHFIAIIVWPDSFASFSAVKDALVRAKFEYRLIPFAENAKAYLGEGADEWLVQ